MAFSDQILQQMSNQLEDIKNVLLQMRALQLETNQILKGVNVNSNILTEQHPSFTKITEDSAGTHFIEK